MYKLSICIPTYNRAVYLRNCLNSVISNDVNLIPEVQVCVSNNCSTDETEEIVHIATKHIPVKYNRNSRNCGVARNILKVVEMADGEFVWLIGDDDLLMPNAIREAISLINKYSDIDFFFVNSNHLTVDYVLNFPQPFSLSNLPPKMVTFSSKKESCKIKFLDLVDPMISFDFLGGMFLSMFRRENWNVNLNVIDQMAISDDRTFSCFDNTFPHVKIFTKAFANSKAYLCARPLSVCLTGAREWAPMYPLVKSVRLLEALDLYRGNGLSFIQYLRCKNAVLDTFIPDIVKMFLKKDTSGFNYIKPLKLILSNCPYPNFYLSAVYPVFRKMKKFILHFISLTGYRKSYKNVMRGLRAKRSRTKQSSVNL